MSTTVSPTAKSTLDYIVLSGVDWGMYASLRDAPQNDRLRMTYDDGDLYLMSPGKLHERIGDLLLWMIHTWVDYHRIPIGNTGSTTLRSELLDRGFEPDKSFFIQNEAAVRGLDQHDPQRDPPPDLTIEVDVTSLSNVRMPIYAAFGVPEVWRWRDDELTVFRLDGSVYAEIDHSIALPGFPVKLAAATLDRRNETDETSLIAEFRAKMNGPADRNDR